MSKINFSFTGFDHFTIENGRLHACWTDASRYDNENLPAWYENADHDLHDCGQVLALEFALQVDELSGEKDLQSVKITTEYGYHSWNPAETSDKLEQVVADYRELYRMCPASMRSTVVV